MRSAILQSSPSCFSRARSCLGDSSSSCSRGAYRIAALPWRAQRLWQCHSHAFQQTCILARRLLLHADRHGCRAVWLRGVSNDPPARLQLLGYCTREHADNSTDASTGCSNLGWRGSLSCSSSAAGGAHEDDGLCACSLGQLRQLGQLAGAQVGLRVGPLQLLVRLPHHLGSSNPSLS